VIDRQRLRPILRERQVSFQRTRTSKKSRDPDKGATLDRIEVELRFTPALVLGEDQLRQSERQGDRAEPFAGGEPAGRGRGRVWGTHGTRSIPEDVLWRARVAVRRNDGAPGIDKITLVDVEEYGVGRLLDELAQDLRNGRWRPLPARRVFIPKPGTVEQRLLSIPSARDRIGPSTGTAARRRRCPAMAVGPSSERPAGAARRVPHVAVRSARGRSRPAAGRRRHER
jgi:hypothetical protein